MPSPLEFEFVGAVMRLPGVRAKLDQVADRLSSRLDAIAGQASARSKTKVTRTDGTRPGRNAKDGVRRPYARVGLATRATRLTAQGELARALDQPAASTAARQNVTARSPRI